MNKTRIKIIGLIRLFRFELPSTAGFCVILGQFLASGSLPRLSDLALGFLSIFFISATALILNDYFDYEIDKVNAPERPLPAGIVTKREVLILSNLVAILGMISSAFISFSALLVTIVVWIVGVAYNSRFKRTGLLGNLMVSFSVGMTFIFGGIVVGHPTDAIVWWFGILAMLFDLGEEIASDAMDIEGDKLIGSRSLAIVIGPQKTLRVSAVIFSAVVLVSFIPFIFQWLKQIFLIPMLLMDAIILYSTVRLLNSKVNNPRRIIRWNYLGASLSILIFILLRLALP
jgi:geranylgeranylglycerol-phosphate geranylgeranyltransferase